MQRGGLLMAAVVVASSWPHAAAAERRSFVRINEFGTSNAEVARIEVNVVHTSVGQDGISEAPQRFAMAFAVRYGLSDRLDIGATYAFAQQSAGTGAAPAGTASALGFEQVRVDARYHLLERGHLVALAPRLAVGVNPATRVAHVDAALVLERDVGPVTAVANVAVTGERDPSGKTWGTRGNLAGYVEVTPRLRLGAEVAAQRTFAAGAQTALQLGPTVAWTSAHRLWAVIGIGYGLTAASDRLYGAAWIGCNL